MILTIIPVIKETRPQSSRGRAGNSRTLTPRALVLPICFIAHGPQAHLTYRNTASEGFSVLLWDPSNHTWEQS